MSDDTFEGLGDVINLLAAPIASGLRTVEQVKRGIDEMFRAVENLNRTMENLNDAAERVNRLLADVEEPIRAMMPQLTRTIRTADEITQRLEGPVRASAPNIEKLIATLSSPGFATLPNQLGEFIATVGDVSKRLSPLVAFAENAGGLFGGFKIPGMSSPPRPPARVVPEPAPAAPAKEPAAKKAAAKKASGAKKSTGTKSTGTKKAGGRG